VDAEKPGLRLSAVPSLAVIVRALRVVSLESEPELLDHAARAKESASTKIRPGTRVVLEISFTFIVFRNPPFQIIHQ
jgi:hypothetical protein